MLVGRWFRRTGLEDKAGPCRRGQRDPRRVLLALCLPLTGLGSLHTLVLCDPLTSLEGLSSTTFCRLFQFQWNLVFLLYYKKLFSQIQPGLFSLFVGLLKWSVRYILMRLLQRWGLFFAGVLNGVGGWILWL